MNRNCYDTLDGVGKVKRSHGTDQETFSIVHKRMDLSVKKIGYLSGDKTKLDDLDK